MQNNSNVKLGLLTLSSSFKTVRSRKTVLVFIIIGCFVIYLASSYLLPAHRHFHQSQLTQSEYKTKTCLDKYLIKWMKLMEENDAIIKRIPASTTENRFYPFTGNGNIGFGMDGDKGKFNLLTSSGNVESYLPVLDIKIKEKNELQSKAIVMNLKTGMVFMITTYDIEQSCVLIEEKFYAHRNHTGLFHQEIKLMNYGLFPIEVSFQPRELQKGLKKKISNVHSTKNSVSQNLQSFSGAIRVKKNSKNIKGGIISFNTVMSNYQRVAKVPQKGQNKVQISSLTDFEFIETTDDDREFTSTGEEQIKKNIEQLDKLMKGNFESDHLGAWDELWKVGVTISSEKDPDSPSPLHVNLTEYYMYSTFLHNVSDVESLNCYTGPSTIHIAKQWVIPNNLKSLYSQRELWKEFFKLNGCAFFSALSLRELMVLSIVGLQFQKKLLQIALNPLNLKTNISIRHISLDYFHSSDWFDLQIVVTNHRIEPLLIYIANSGKHTPKIFGCGSACDHVVELGSSKLKFVIHPTDPVTPLFYISTNRTHLEDISRSDYLKKAVRSAKESKADPHHMKLSPKFWISVVILIVSFHVVILKMIYNECRKSRTNGGTRRNPFIN